MGRVKEWLLSEAMESEHLDGPLRRYEACADLQVNLARGVSLQIPRGAVLPIEGTTLILGTSRVVIPSITRWISESLLRPIGEKTAPHSQATR